MNHGNIILPNTSLFLVDRGWKRLQKKSKLTSFKNVTKDSAFDEKDSFLESGAIKAIHQPWVIHIAQNDNGQKKDYKVPRSSKTTSTKCFKFINATEPGRAQDPEVRTIIRSHVKNGVRRGRKSTQSTPTKPSGDPLPKGDKESPDLENATSLRLNLIMPGTSWPLYGKGPFSMPVDPRSDYLLKYCTN